MSRVIKFRKWHNELQDMTFWDGTPGSNNLFWHTLTEYPAMYNLTQFTGLIDKNGTEIYEGDIIEGHSDGNGKIVWNNDYASYDYEFSDGNIVGIWEVIKDLKVIGNIYENPELL